MSIAGLSKTMAANKDRFAQKGQDALVLKELADRFELEGITYFFLGSKPHNRGGGFLISTFIDDCTAQKAILMYDEVDIRIISRFPMLLPQPWSIRPRWGLSNPSLKLAEINLEVNDFGVTVPIYEENRGTAFVSITGSCNDTNEEWLDAGHLLEFSSFAALLHEGALDKIDVQQEIRHRS